MIHTADHIEHVYKEFEEYNAQGKFAVKAVAPKVFINYEKNTGSYEEFRYCGKSTE